MSSSGRAVLGSPGTAGTRFQSPGLRHLGQVTLRSLHPSLGVLLGQTCPHPVAWGPDAQRTSPATAPRRGTGGARLSPPAGDSPLATGRGLGRTEGRTPTRKPGTQLARAPAIPGGRAAPAAAPGADPGAGRAAGRAVSGPGMGGGARERKGGVCPAHPPARPAHPRTAAARPSPCPPAARAPPAGHGTGPRGPSARPLPQAAQHRSEKSRSGNSGQG